MYKTIFLSLFLIIFNCGFGQSDFKKSASYALNIVTGYETFNSFSDLNAKLELAGLEKTGHSHLLLGVGLEAYDKRNMLSIQGYASDLLSSDLTSGTRFQTLTVCMLYGYDLIPKIRYTFLYPIGGLRLHLLNVLSKHENKTKIDSYKPITEAGIGTGCRLSFNKEVKVNNFELNFLIAVPVINSRWRELGRDLISDTYKVKPTFNVTFIIGRATYIK